MIENNVFRILMFIGAVVLLGMGINMGMDKLPEIKSLIEDYYHNRIQKY